jgi:hypothetical protein
MTGGGAYAGHPFGAFGGRMPCVDRVRFASSGVRTNLYAFSRNQRLRLSLHRQNGRQWPAHGVAAAIGFSKRKPHRRN